MVCSTFRYIFGLQHVVPVCRLGQYNSSEICGILAFDGLLPPSFLFSSRTLTSSNSDMHREDKPSSRAASLSCRLQYFARNILPLRSKKSKANDPPWMNPTLSNLIRHRQKALNQGNIDEFKRLRNHVNRKRKSCRAKYYESSVQHLKQCKPSNWWKEVKRLTTSCS